MVILLVLIIYVLYFIIGFCLWLIIFIYLDYLCLMIMIELRTRKSVGVLFDNLFLFGICFIMGLFYVFVLVIMLVMVVIVLREEMFEFGLIKSKVFNVFLPFLLSTFLTLLLIFQYLLYWSLLICIIIWVS